ncbi:hypothetical protein GCM10027280_02800 [Micromonospora polyrhachis]
MTVHNQPFARQGRIDPGSRRLPASVPATPDRPSRCRAAPSVADHVDRRARSHPGQRRIVMSEKPQPEATDEAREQARRALQTSMDTRQ